MTKEVAIPVTNDGKSMARLTRLKWLVAALLVVALVLGWMARKPVKTTEVTESIEFSDAGAAARSTPTSPAGSSAATTSSSASQPAPATSAIRSPAAPSARAGVTDPSLVLERRVDGRITVRGRAADAATRDQWLNAIRIGAQGGRVDSELDVAEVQSAAPWEARLRQLTALVGDRRLSRFELEGRQLLIEGPAVATSYRQETERLFRAQLPDGFEVHYRSVSPSTGGAQPPASVPPVAAAPVPGSSSAPAPAPGTPATATASTAPVPAPVREAQPQAAPADKAARPPAGCPAQLDQLAANVYFRTDSVGIGRGDRNRLTQLGRCLGSRQVNVIGFADSRHTSQYNLDLSMRRAQAVADLIRSQAPRGAVIRVSAQGAERGKSRGEAERSRRVEIRIR